jgi:AcrR family transcriptional regulator
MAEPRAAHAGPGRPRDPGRDSAILDAAAALLRERGGRRIAMREVAERSGTSLASIYRRWPSREDLIADAIQHLVVGEISLPDTGDVRSDLLTVLETMRHTRGALIANLPLMMAEATSSPEILDTVRKRLLSVAGNAVSTVLQRACSRAQIPAGPDLGLVAETAVALFAQQGIVHARAPTRAYVTRIVDYALLPMLGLGLPRASGIPPAAHQPEAAR